MKLAIATKQDFRRFWSIYRAAERLNPRWDHPSELRARRCRALIEGRLQQLGGGFMRVVMGCESLIATVCKPEAESHIYELQPVFGAAPELLEALIRAERKLSAYVGVCTGDKELTEAVLPMAHAALEAAGAA